MKAALLSIPLSLEGTFPSCRGQNKESSFSFPCSSLFHTETAPSALPSPMSNTGLTFTNLNKGVADMEESQMTDVNKVTMHYRKEQG